MLRKKDQTPSPNARQSSVASDDPISMALAKLKDPPKPSEIVGQVISAKGLMADSSQPSHSAPVTPKPVPIAPAQESRKDLFSPEHIPVLKDVLAQRVQKKSPEPDFPTEVIAPTAPDAEAPIAAQLAAKKQEELDQKQAEDAKKLHVDPAVIVERPLDKKRLYVLLGSWLAAIPVALGSYSGLNLVGANEGVAESIGMFFVYAIASYALVGLIPLVLLYIRTWKG